MSIEGTSVGAKQIDVQQLVSAHRGGAIGAVRRVQPGAAESTTSAGSSGDFAALLQSKVDGLRFSAHATSRIKSRNIAMTPEVMGKLEKAVSGAAGKGARDSLILMRDLAFIVNIPNRTVVTAMDGESIRDNVFTNIDSTVLAD